MAYSLDFRKHVFKVKEEEKLTIAETAERFKISIASIVRWNNKLEPQTTRQKPPTKIDTEALKQDIQDFPDAYQHERAERLGVSQMGICHALKRLKITYKKL